MFRRGRIFRWIGAIIMIGLLVGGAHGQDEMDGLGVIIESNLPGYTEDGLLNAFDPAACGNADCFEVFPFLFPTLYTFDPIVSDWVGAQRDNTALVIDPTLTSGAPQTLRLRDDLTWSDGVPVTAYDVLFTLLGYADAGFLSIDAIRLVDAHTLSVSLTEVDCGSARRLNTAIVPSHIYLPDFSAFVDAHAALSWLNDWRTAWREDTGGLTFSSVLFNTNVDVETMPTAGRFTVDVVRSGRDLRLRGAPDFNPDLAFVYVDSEVSATEAFLRGETNLLIEPPFDRRADLRTHDDIRIDEFDSYAMDWLVFNLGDPQYPRDAFVDGAPLEQIPHPIFSDLNVRRAVQLAIDVEQIIDTVFYGNATITPSYLPPTSWAFDPDLAPIGYDPIEASRLLFAAGWRDTDGDGIRECITCTFTSLLLRRAFNVTLFYTPDITGTRSRAAAVIAAQLRRVGIAVNLMEAGGRSQRFDLFLTGSDRFWRGARDPDQGIRFSREGDLIERGANVGSYHNPRVESLFAAARNVPDCDRAARAALYGEIQAILQAEQPAAWLYARREMVVSRGITGIAPQAGAPYWNILAWRVHP